jgi:hypothetical protein
MTTIKITMSECRPLTIEPALWPVIARADWHNGEHKFQANDIRKIRVRQHADGRRIVYGLQEAGNGGQHHGTRNPEGGFLLLAEADENELIRAIRRVGGIIGDDDLAQKCIADLPAEDIDEATKRHDTIAMPREGAGRLLRILDEVAGSGLTDPRYTADLRGIADELRAALTAATAAEAVQS